MAFHSVTSTSSVFPSRPRPSRTKANSRSISCRIRGEGPSGDDYHDANEIKKSNICPFFNLLSVPVTLTIISTALPQPASAAPSKVSERRRGAKKAPEALTPEQLKSWSEGLPVVTDRIPYTDLVELKKEGRLKHVIKASGGSLRKRVEPVLVVLDDSRVARTVLPSLQGNRRFWEKWDELEIESLCVNAFTPPLKKPNLPSPYLGIQLGIPGFVQKWFEPKKLSKRALELRKMREEINMRREVDLELTREERQIMEKAMKVQKKEEATRRRREIQKRKYEESLIEASRTYAEMAKFWRDLAHNENFTTLLGFVFFALFYRTVVLSYKKQQKDYEDRVKIERAEADERNQKTEVEKMMQTGAFEKGDELAEEATGEQNPYMKMAKQFMKSGARVRRAGVRKLPQYLETDVDVKFSDVAGLGKIRLELEEIVKFFTHGDMYRRRGIKIPGGILLCGPPGVGKTLLAKAVAGEAGVSFFSISASQFVEIYVGVGASRVRALYQEARESAPSVVFIDEIDAVGRKRGLIKGSGGQERDATLNQLLVSLDGFEGKGEVITIASTNRPDILDDALVRPGRFDRKIYIPKPGVIGRVEILKVHARNKPMAYDVDYLAVASVTDGMVGAELANIIEVAAINMTRDGRTEITTDDLLQAAQMEERGILDKKERSPEAWKQIAVNEAAIAVVAVNLPELKNVEYITIAPRAGRELGYVRTKMDYFKFQTEMLSRQSLLDHITILLAPRAADELCFGKTQLSTIWAETADDARRAARMLILRGLSEKHYGLNNFWVSDRINEIDSEALRILNICYDRVKEILQDNRKLLDAVVEELVQKKSLTKPEFAQLVERYGSIRPMPPTIIDIRAAKLTEFKEKMMTMKESQEKEVVDV